MPFPLVHLMLLLMRYGYGVPYGSNPPLMLLRSQEDGIDSDGTDGARNGDWEGAEVPSVGIAGAVVVDKDESTIVVGLI